MKNLLLFLIVLLSGTSTAYSQNADSIRYREISQYLIERNHCIEINEWYVQQLIISDSLILEYEKSNENKSIAVSDSNILSLHTANESRDSDRKVKELLEKLKKRTIALGGTTGALLVFILIAIL